MGRLKTLGLRYLPRPLVAVAKRYHYRRVVAATTMDDEPEFAVVRGLVRPGDRVLDIGANIGVYSKILSQLVGASGQVLAFEPVPMTYGFLSFTIRQLQMTNVKAFNVALSDKSGQAVMEVPQFEQGVDNYYMARIMAGAPDSTLQHALIRCERLDDVLKTESTPIAFMKIDVEGHELECIQGAVATIEQSRPSLLIEVGGEPDESGSRAARLFAILRELGYQYYLYDGSRLRLRVPGDRSVNYFFLTAEHVAQLDGSLIA